MTKTFTLKIPSSFAFVLFYAIYLGINVEPDVLRIFPPFSIQVLQDFVDVYSNISYSIWHVLFSILIALIFIFLRVRNKSYTFVLLFRSTIYSNQGYTLIFMRSLEDLSNFFRYSASVDESKHILIHTIENRNLGFIVSKSFIIFIFGSISFRL